MFGRVASLLVADEAVAVPHMLHSFAGREIDLVHVHGIGIRASSPSSQWDITVSSSSEFPESYHVLVKLSCVVKPLFPFPTGLFLTVWEGGSGHHNGKLLGYSSLEGIH